jgi:outer membrane protein OmpA-like peptidoglycan-associated protein
MQGPEGQKSVHMDVPMLPVSSSEPVLLANVFFDLGKSTLRNESHVELNKLFDFLVANPRLKIEIGGHTDTRGNDKENLILSTDRAKSVVDYLKQKGIPEQQLLYKGYGELNPVVSDEEIAKLAEENEKEAAHQSNRRTEYKILK